MSRSVRRCAHHGEPTKRHRDVQRERPGEDWQWRQLADAHRQACQSAAPSAFRSAGSCTAALRSPQESQCRVQRTGRFATANRVSADSSSLGSEPQDDRNWPGTPPPFGGVGPFDAARHASRNYRPRILTANSIFRTPILEMHRLPIYIVYQQHSSW
jgi:hypothetical protein